MKCIDREGVVGSHQQYQQDVPEELDDVPEEEVQVSGPPNGPFPARVPRPTAKGGQCMCVIFVSSFYGFLGTLGIASVFFL